MMRRTLSEIEKTVVSLVKNEIPRTPDILIPLRNDILTYNPEDFSFNQIKDMQRVFMYHFSLNHELLDLFDKINQEWLNSSQSGLYLYQNNLIDSNLSEEKLTEMFHDEINLESQEKDLENKEAYFQNRVFERNEFDDKSENNDILYKDSDLENQNEISKSECESDQKLDLSITIIPSKQFNKTRYRAFYLKIKALRFVDFTVKNAVTSEWVLSNLTELSPFRSEMALFKNQRLPLLYIEFFNQCAKFNFDMLAFLNDKEMLDTIDSICVYLENLAEIEDLESYDEFKLILIQRNISKIINFVFGCHLLDFRVQEEIKREKMSFEKRIDRLEFQKLYYKILKMSILIPLFAFDFVESKIFYYFPTF